MDNLWTISAPNFSPQFIPIRPHPHGDKTSHGAPWTFSTFPQIPQYYYYDYKITLFSTILPTPANTGKLPQPLWTKKGLSKP